MRHTPSLAALLTPVVLTAVAGAEEVECDPGEPTAARITPEIDETDAARGDGVYGRFAGNLDLGVHLGVQVDGEAPAATAELSAHYFFMAGVYLRYSDAFGQDTARFLRTVSGGIDLRPAFIPRWSRARQSGPGFLDLTIDSISLSLGAFWAAHPAPEESTRGFEGALGVSLPLTGRAGGLWLDLRGMGRWPDPGGPSDDRQFAFVAMLAWHSIVSTPM